MAGQRLSTARDCEFPLDGSREIGWSYGRCLEIHGRLRAGRDEISGDKNRRDGDQSRRLAVTKTSPTGQQIAAGQTGSQTRRASENSIAAADSAADALAQSAEIGNWDHGRGN